MPIAIAESILVDTSVVVDALVGADGAALRAQLLGKQLHAPDLIDYEVMSALRGLHLGRQLTEERALDALGDFYDLGIRRHPLRLMASQAWALRHGVTAYDGAYAALADVLRIPLWTRDRRLAAAVPEAVVV